MPIEFVDFYRRSDVRGNPDKLYVFGDNEDRWGKAGQAAACRGEANAVGITTKRSPSMSAVAFYFDGDLKHWRDVNRQSFARLEDHLKNGGTVVWPKDGIGTGLAKLPSKAPRIAKEIGAWVEESVVKYNQLSILEL